MPASEQEKTEQKHCPCKRVKCERHGNCRECMEYHFSPERKRKLLTACEREAKRKGKKE